MRKILVAFLILILAFLANIHIAGTVGPVMAQDEPDRVTWITTDLTVYDWMLVKWADNSVACRVTIDHEGMPTTSEIQKNCAGCCLPHMAGNPPM